MGGPNHDLGPLYAGTAYSFRVCGNDQGQQPVCAQMRTFSTPVPARDVVEGTLRDGPPSPHSDSGEVQVTVTASGTPTGTVRLPQPPLRAHGVAGRRRLLVVSGRTAVIGSVGQANTDAPPPQPDGPANAWDVLKVVDGGPGAVNQIGGLRATVSSTTPSPPSCSSPQAVAPMTTQSVNVTDVP